MKIGKTCKEKGKMERKWRKNQFKKNRQKFNEKTKAKKKIKSHRKRNRLNIA